MEHTPSEQKVRSAVTGRFTKSVSILSRVNVHAADCSGSPHNNAVIRCQNCEQLHPLFTETDFLF